METLPPIRWAPAAGLIWMQYDDSDNWVVYNPASATVHLLTPSARLLWELLAGARTHAIEDLALVLAGGVGQASLEELKSVTAEMVAFMDDAGLIRPVSF